MTETNVDQTEAATAEVQQVAKESNNDRKRRKLEKQAVRAHEWRVQVWAQCEIKIRAANAELAVLGGEPIQTWEPDFTSEENLHHYASMTLTK